MAKAGCYTHFVEIPTSLKKDELLDSVGIGLYYLWSDLRPSEIPNTELTKVRVRLSKEAQEYLVLLCRSGEFRSKTEIINLALSYLSEQPAWKRATTI